MERRFIRPRWQVTIPREIRRRLNLFVGQALSFTLDEHYNIIMTTGSLPDAEQAEFYKLFKGEKKPFGPLKKFGISKGRRTSKIERLKSARFGKLEKMMKHFPADPDLVVALDEAREAEDARQDLKGLVSNMSRFLMKVQERL